MVGQYIFGATVRAPGGASDSSCEQRFARLMAGQMWTDQQVCTEEGGDLLLDAYISFPAASFAEDPDSEHDRDEQARLWAADELEDLLSGSGFELYGDVDPSDSF